jgi:hypothetical protein
MERCAASHSEPTCRSCVVNLWSVRGSQIPLRTWDWYEQHECLLCARFPLPCPRAGFLSCDRACETWPSCCCSCFFKQLLLLLLLACVEPCWSFSREKNAQIILGVIAQTNDSIFVCAKTKKSRGKLFARSCNYLFTGAGLALIQMYTLNTQDLWTKNIYIRSTY